MSNEALRVIKKSKRKKKFIVIMRILLLFCFFLLWELLSDYKIINSFIFSSPSLIWKTGIDLFIHQNLLLHICTTLYETILSFAFGISLGFILAILLYELPTLSRVIDPFLTMLNSLPKVALGPMIILFAGANQKAIIIMALCINLIVSILNIYNGFLGTDEYKIKLLKSMGATKVQLLTNLVIPESKRTIISSLKINISMTLIGVIMGEFLVSKRGIGYLIIYGTQIFNLNLVMTGIILLAIISYLLYELIFWLEKKFT